MHGSGFQEYGKVTIIFIIFIFNFAFLNFFISEKGGVPRSLEWKKAEKKSSYSYQDALSFILLADWIRERLLLLFLSSLFLFGSFLSFSFFFFFSFSAEEQFLFPLQSQIICESYSITNPVNVLVCDCLAGGGSFFFLSLSLSLSLSFSLALSLNLIYLIIKI